MRWPSVQKMIRWANEGRPVYRDGRAVAEGHPYDDQWGCCSIATRGPPRRLIDGGVECSGGARC